MIRTPYWALQRRTATEVLLSATVLAFGGSGYRRHRCGNYNVEQTFTATLSCADCKARWYFTALKLQPFFPRLVRDLIPSMKLMERFPSMEYIGYYRTKSGLQPDPTTVDPGYAQRILLRHSVIIDKVISQCGNCNANIDVESETTCTSCGVVWRFSILTRCSESPSLDLSYTDFLFPELAFIGEGDTIAGLGGRELRLYLPADIKDVAARKIAAEASEDY